MHSLPDIILLSLASQLFLGSENFSGNLSHVLWTLPKHWQSQSDYVAQIHKNYGYNRARISLFVVVRPKTGLDHNLLMYHGITSLAILWSLGIHIYISNYIAS